MMGLIRHTTLVLVLSFSLQVDAQDTVYIVHNTIPTLGGHRFVSLPVIGSPFLNSTVQLRMGVEGSDDLVLPLPDFLPDSISGPDGSLAFVNLDFTYRQKIKDWISFYLSANIAVRSGTELGTLLFEGVNTLIGGETGIVFNIFNNEKQQLSGVLKVSNHDVTIINFGKFVSDILDGVANPSVTEDVPTLTAGAGLSYALGISEVVGFSAHSTIHYGESIQRGKTQAKYSLGGAFDFNWVSKGVPLGVSLGHLMRSTSDEVYVDDEFAHTTALKLAYTAAPDFIIGVELSSSSFPVFSLPNSVRSTGFMLNIDYYFN